MKNTIYIENVCSKPDFVALMNLYDRNYRLMVALLEGTDKTEITIRNKDSYALQIFLKYRSRYTQNLDLHYSFHTQKQGRKIVVAVADFKVRLYSDTRQAEVTIGRIELEKPFPGYGILLSLRAKWYYNQCLGAVLRSFFAVPLWRHADRQPMK